MKLRGVLILSIVGLLAAFFLTERYIAGQQYNACDMVEINNLYKNVEENIGIKDIPELEKEYDCLILLRGEDDYYNKLYKAIRESDLIFDYMVKDQLLGKIIFPANENSFLRLKRNLEIVTGIMFFVIIIILCSVSLFLYKRILEPFYRLKSFASNIAGGNLDIPLTMDRGNYFGAFTESFDLMREELSRARLGEYEANKSKKELVAQLSHDIKTPVSTIKALCELLIVKVMDDDIKSKLLTIDQKAEIIDKLISNMFHATLEELSVLKIEPREEYSTIILAMLEDLNYYGKIHRRNELPECLIYCDKLRLNQVIDNIINNSYKYADTDIDVYFREEADGIVIEIKDYGSSITENDLPLVFEKYYRGENVASQSGSGLGLYLARLFMEGMEGSVACRYENGFVVRLFIKKA